MKLTTMMRITLLLFLFLGITNAENWDGEKAREKAKVVMKENKAMQEYIACRKSARSGEDLKKCMELRSKAIEGMTKDLNKDLNKK